MTHIKLNDLQILLLQGWSLSEANEKMAVFLYEEDDYLIRVQLFDVGQKTPIQLATILTGIKLDEHIEYYGRLKYTTLNAYQTISEVKLKGNPLTNEQGISSRHFLGYNYNHHGGHSVQSLSVLFYPEKKSGKLPAMMKTLNDFLLEMYFIAQPIQQPDTLDLYRSKLGNTKFSFYDSYNSGFGEGGYGTSWEIFLYDDRSFRYLYESYTSVSFRGTSLGGGAKSENGVGEWRLSQNAYTEKVLLSLLFSDGRRKSYTLHLTAGKAWLNDTQMHWSRI